jgi:hypothetical protein
MFRVEVLVGTVAQVDLLLRFRVPPVALKPARPKVETAAAESEIRVDLAQTPGKLLERAVRNPVKLADGATRRQEFAAAVPREAAAPVQWLWKPG